ncbi:hypothetical protein [Streptomyces buecherae]|uniref:hypothetical protein n=1 Tax=Streptomyces buecherae TaxID=2763006 RepID=UPI0027E1DF3C|nr:hypothetical protein [Streptomyces buecherae]
MYEPFDELDGASDGGWRRTPAGDLDDNRRLVQGDDGVGVAAEESGISAVEPDGSTGTVEYLVQFSCFVPAVSWR